MNVSMQKIEDICKEAEADLNRLNSVLVVKEESETGITRRYICLGRAVAITRRIQDRFRYIHWRQQDTARGTRKRKKGD